MIHMIQYVTWLMKTTREVIRTYQRATWLECQCVIPSICVSVHSARTCQHVHKCSHYFDIYIHTYVDIRKNIYIHMYKYTHIYVYLYTYI